MSGAAGPAESPQGAAVERLCGPWTVQTRQGRASSLIDAAEPPESGQRRVVIHHVERPALVLGSAQRLDLADVQATEAASVDLARRHSGGGAVLLRPAQQVWVDFFVPAGDSLWSDDVGEAVVWVGELWSSVVGSFIDEPATAYAGRLIADRWGRLVCFAGQGPGEVFVSERKLVGVSQRRNRHRARIQTMARLAPGSASAPASAVSGEEQCQQHGAAAGSEADFLSLTPQERGELRSALSIRSGALPAGNRAVTQALLDALEAWS